MRLLLLILFVVPICLFSQNNYVPLNDCARFYHDQLLYQQDNSHPSIKPYRLNELADTFRIEENYNIGNSGLSKLLSEDFLKYDNRKNYFTLNPVINSFFGNHKSDGYGSKSIGFDNHFSINDKIFGHSYFAYTSEQYNEQSFAWINYSGVVPMHGAYIKKDFNKRRLNYQWFNGSISYAPSKYLDFQFGKEKNFLGDGYRSLLLSDNSDSYPFVKASVKIWKVKYIVLYNIWKDIDSDLYDNRFYKKYATTHYLSWNVWKRLNLNLFETVIWRGADSLGTRGYDVNYMNPIIFFRPVEYSLGSPDNVIMGGGIRLKLWNNTHLYHQTVLDEFKLSEVKAKNGWWANKFGFQFGLKAFDIFKIEGLYTQIEYNVVRPFTYSHRNSLENYGHHYQSMTHPLGANFSESIFILRYHKKRFYSSLRIMNAEYGEMQDSVNVGHNIYLSYEYNRNEYGNNLLQGRKCSILVSDLRLGWIVNPKWNLSLETGVKYWEYSNNVMKENRFYFLFGLKTNLYKSNFDY